MNERIRQLAEQACAFADIQYNKQTRATFYTNKSVEEFFREKFAELMVRECMACSTWVGKMNTNSCEPIQTAHAINQRIKKQFGVEE